MKNISILIAEDDSALRKQLIEYISIFVETIYEASDGKEALALYQEQSIDILFCDINMPKLNGLDLIEKIRKEDKEIEIIIISAYTDTSYLLRAIELHLVSYLIKPIESSKLKEALLTSITKVKAKKSLKNLMIALPLEYQWDTQHKELYCKDVKIALSHYEKLFIAYLIKNKNNTLSYEAIHHCIYINKPFTKNAITSLVKRLRQKTHKSMIKTSHSEGYRI
ncbi:MAG: response regulator [Sulfurovum sp.]|nr:response regulator [Sulfurovum sp.]